MDSEATFRMMNGMALPADPSARGCRPGWEELLGNPDVHLDGEYAAVEAIRAWVGAAPATAGIFRPTEPVLPADRFTWLEDAVPSTTPELTSSGR